MASGRRESDPDPARRRRSRVSRRQPPLRRDARCSPGSTSRSRRARRSALVGPSGCGKSTLLELVAGLQPLQAGAIAIDGRSVAGRPDRAVALMPQRDLLLPWSGPLDNAAARAAAGRTRSPREHGGGPPRCSSASASPASPTPGPTSSRAGCASGSRSCARCSPGSPVLLLDEPFAALDAITRGEMQELAARRRSRRARTHAARHPRRRGGALPRRPRAASCRRARPRRGQ